MYYTLDYRRQICDRVVQLIAESGRSERELSMAMDCDPSYLNKIVNGKGNFSMPRLLKFLDIMGITPEEFFPVPLDMEESELKLSEQDAVAKLFAEFKNLSPEAQNILVEILVSYNKFNR